MKIVENPVNIENDELIHFLNQIWDTFGKYSADELEYMTHQEEPWAKARNNICCDLIHRLIAVDFFLYLSAGQRKNVG